jgi:hypothetical protein
MSRVNNIHDKINLRHTARSWAIITIKELGKALKKKRIGKSGELERSLAYVIKGNPAKANFRVEIITLKYGAFVDMGVGRGVRLGDRRDHSTVSKLLGSKRIRRPKKWYAGTIYGQSKRLGELVHGKLSDKAVNVVDALPDKIVMNF